MATLEELAAALLGQQTQANIAAENPYYRGRDVFDTVGNSAIKIAASDPTRYGAGETAAAAGVSGLLSGLFGSAGDSYQNTLTGRYTDVIAGKNPTGEGLPAGLFGQADRQKTLFGLQQQMQDQQENKKFSQDLIKIGLQNPQAMPQVQQILSGGKAPVASPEPAAPAAPAEPSLFQSNAKDLTQQVNERSAELLRNTPGLTPNAALEQARFELRGATNADSAEMKQLSKESDQIRLADELVQQAESAIARAGDTGGVPGVPGSLPVQRALKWAFKPDEAKAFDEMGSLGASFVAAARIPGTGAMSDQEMQLFQKAGVSISNEPEVNQAIVNKMKAVNELNKQYLDFKNQYLVEKGTLRGANEEWHSRYIEKVKDLPAEARPGWRDVFSGKAVEKEAKAANPIAAAPSREALLAEAKRRGLIK